MDVVKQVLRRYRKDLLHLPNVVGVGVGKKLTRGVETDEPVVVVFVEKKLPPDSLLRRALVPQTVGESKTDVVETGRFRFLNELTGRHRPARPGVSIGHYKITAGTFGALVYDRKTGEPLILSNNHILANASNGKDRRAKIGDPILQPGPYDGGVVNRDTIATLERFIPMHLQTAPATCPVASGVEYYLNTVLRAHRPEYSVRLYRKLETNNTVDCAVAKPVKPDMVKGEIIKIGNIKGTTEATPGVRLHKCGRTSGYTKGTLKYVDVTSTVDVGEGRRAVFEDQFMATAMSKAGDSGSLVLDEYGKAVGLLFAGSDKYTLCNRIQNVLDVLSVRF